MSAAISVPPQPKGNLVTGHLAPVARDPLGRLTRYAREYGDVVKLRLLYLPALLVSHPRLIEQVLVNQSGRYFKSIDTRETKILLGNGLLTSEGETWKRHRRAMQPAFHQGRIADYSRIVTASAEEVIAGWQDGERRDLRREMTRITLRSATRALFGTDLAKQENEVGRAIDSLFRLFDVTSGWAYLLPNYLPTPIHLRALAAMRRLDRLIGAIITSRQKKKKDGDGQDLLDMILALCAWENGTGYKMARDQVMTLLVAGHETTSTALTWSWYLLARNPEVEKKLHEELDEVLGGRAPRQDDLPRLVYTKRVVNETLRLYPPAWTMGREAIEDTEVGGFRVRKGTTVYLPQWVVQRDPRFFPDPDRFDPGRWTERFSRDLPSFAFFPFGGGQRVCIGASFARMEACLVLATIAQRFRFTMESTKPVVPWPSVTLRPRDGLPSALHLRKAGQFALQSELAQA